MTNVKKPKIVLTDAQTVVDGLVSADILNELGEVVSYGLLEYEEVAEKIADESRSRHSTYTSTNPPPPY